MLKHKNQSDEIVKKILGQIKNLNLQQAIPAIEKQFKSLESKSPTPEYILLKYANQLQTQKKMAGASEVFKHINKTYPNYWTATLAYACHLEDLGQFLPAIEIIKSKNGFRKHRYDMWLVYCRLLEKAGKLTEANKEYTNLCKMIATKPAKSATLNYYIRYAHAYFVKNYSKNGFDDAERLCRKLFNELKCEAS